MKYIEYALADIPSEEASEIAVAELADLGFDSFSDYEAGGRTLSAYIAAEAEAASREAIEEYLKGSGYNHTRAEMAGDVNWNALWESNFEPVDVGRCRVRAPFHPAGGAQHEIVIMPKMSFGTGHHATTRLMLEAMLDTPMTGATVLDMGSGTGVLAILAAMQGAEAVDAIDIDRWACDNCAENIAANGVEGRVRVRQGDASLLDGAETYDVILANINRNILLRDMPALTGVLRGGGAIFFSGFLEIDVPMLRAAAEGLGMTAERVETHEGWAMLAARKA